MAKLYLNRFSIEEDDQFEIHVKDFTDKDVVDGGDIYKVTEELISNERLVQQGSGVFGYSLKPVIKIRDGINIPPNSRQQFHSPNSFHCS